MFQYKIQKNKNIRYTTRIMPREEKIETLNIELQKLNDEMETLAKLINESSTQFGNIKKFGMQQASFFMSAHAVFQKLNEENEKKV